MKTNSRWKWTQGHPLLFGLLWLCFGGTHGTFAQPSAAASQTEDNFRLLTAAEGRAIVATALQQDQQPNGAQDCSHAVHQFYLDAGFAYEYASSFEIYAGNENFARVKTPQAGDLIAWSGHVGIVVNPMQHSFYSLVSNGLDTQDYDGPYWSSRGRPRFFRYKVVDSGTIRAAKTAPPQRNADTKLPKTVSERKVVIRRVQDPETPETSREDTEPLSSILIAAHAKQPTRNEVAKGISELTSAAGSMLRSDDPLKLSSSVVIFEKFTVEKVEVKRDHGWAQLKIASRVHLAGAAMELKRHDEKVRWELHRTKSGWEVIAPTDRTYVPQDVAVRNLAGQLARLTEQGASSSDQEPVLRRESQLANLLSTLLQNK
jgi:hypothetical protein